MPFLQIHQLLTFHGSLPGNEQWTCGLRVNGPGVNSADLAQMTQQAADRFAIMVSSLATGQEAPWPAGVAFDGVTGRSLNQQGVTLMQAEKSPGVAPVIGAGARFMPNQCAVVVSLITATAGRSGKGRVYLPLLGNIIGNNGKMGASVPPRVANEFRTFVIGLNNDLALTFGSLVKHLIVASQKGLGGESEITGVRVGDVIDTQRRRRASVTESYSAALIEG